MKDACATACSIGRLLAWHGILTAASHLPCKQGTAMSNNTAVAGNGGCLSIAAPLTSLVLSDVQSNSNMARLGSGGFAHSLQQLERLSVQGATCSENAAQNGGWLALEGSTTAATIACVAGSGNAAASSGGMLHVTGSFDLLSLDGLRISKHSAGENGGTVAIQALSRGRVQVSNMTVTSSSAALGSGGALFFKGTFLSIQVDALQAAQCSAGLHGGALAFQGSAEQLSFKNTTITSCNATGNGGSVSMQGNFTGSVTFEDFHAMSNFARAGGGGIFVSAPSGSLMLSRSTFKSNQAGIVGGVTPAEVSQAWKFFLPKPVVVLAFLTSHKKNKKPWVGATMHTCSGKPLALLSWWHLKQRLLSRTAPLTRTQLCQVREACPLKSSFE